MNCPALGPLKYGNPRIGFASKRRLSSWKDSVIALVMTSGVFSDPFSLVFPITSVQGAASAAKSGMWRL